MDQLKPHPTFVRGRILALLVAYTFLGYVLRMNISMAQQFMVPELGLSDIQVGEIFSAFMLGYFLFQLPAGILGDRKGPRIVMAISFLTWGICTLLTGLLPGRWVTGAMAFSSLLILRFILGLGEAAMPPLTGRTIANWLPPSERAFSFGLIIAGLTLGAAFAPPLVANLMRSFGWRATFYVTGVVPFVFVLIWWWQFRDNPAIHKSVSPEELAVITSGQQKIDKTERPSSLWKQLKNRNIAFLCVSYLLESYVLFLFVFWLFKYLVDVRKLSIVNSGWATSLPFIVASVASPSLGYLTDRLSERLGRRRARQMAAVGCLVFAGSLLLVGAGASSIWLTLAAISLSVGFLVSTEACYWTTILDLAGPHAGAAGGLLTMWGNLGGVVSTALMPVLVHWLGWFGALASGSALAVLGAVFWLFIRPESKENTLTAVAGGQAVEYSASTAAD